MAGSVMAGWDAADEPVRRGTIALSMAVIVPVALVAAAFPRR